MLKLTPLERRASLAHLTIAKDVAQNNEILDIMTRNFIREQDLLLLLETEIVEIFQKPELCSAVQRWQQNKTPRLELFFLKACEQGDVEFACGLLTSKKVSLERALYDPLRHGPFFAPPNSLADHNRKGSTGLHFAAESGQAELLATLLQEFEISPKILNCQAGNGKTPLFEAAANGHLDCVKVLCETGQADLSLATKISPTQTPLDTALAAGHLKVAEYLTAKSTGGGNKRPSLDKAASIAVNTKQTNRPKTASKQISSNL